ncbi:MAG: glucokinase [Rhodospirillales bacterium]
MTTGGQDALGLIADIGGTNARFALVGPDGNPFAPEVLSVADYSGPDGAIRAYLDGRGLTGVPQARVALAVAAPVLGDRIALTNGAWAFSTAELSRSLELRQLDIINDFTAQALAVPALAGQHKLGIGGGPAISGAPLAVIGPGTGLGVSGLLPTGEGWLPLVTEGGHVTLPARTAHEAAVIRALGEVLATDHVSAEKALSGFGLVALCRALALVDGKERPLFTTASEITTAAESQADALARQTLEQFFAFLGTVAGDLALSLGARGGVYLAGGILPRLAGPLVQSGFRNRFEDKGRFSTYLAAIPTTLITHPFPALVGLAATLQGQNQIRGQASGAPPMTGRHPG